MWGSLNLNNSFAQVTCFLPDLGNCAVEIRNRRSRCALECESSSERQPGKRPHLGLMMEGVCISFVGVQPILALFQQASYPLWRQNQDDTTYFFHESIYFHLILANKPSEWPVWAGLVSPALLHFPQHVFFWESQEGRKMVSNHFNDQQSKLIKNFIFSSANDPSEVAVPKRE